MWTENFQMYKLALKKAEEPETKLPTFTGSQKMQGSSRKTSISALLTMPKPLTVWITINLVKEIGKFLKRWDYQTTWPASWETCMQVRKQQLTLDTEQQTGSKLGKVYDKAVYLSLCLFNLYLEYIMWNAGLDKAQAGIKNVGRNQQPQICRWYHSNGRKWRGTKELDEGERGEWKSWLKTQYKKIKNIASSPITLWQIEGGKSGNSDRFYFLGLQYHCRWWQQSWN